MDVKEFTKQTLLQIVEGVQEANEVMESSGAYVTNEALYNSKGATLSAKRLNVVEIDFDVAITTTDTEGSNGGAGIKVASFMNIGGNMESKSENQTISRIRYTLPLVIKKKPH